MPAPADELRLIMPSYSRMRQHPASRNACTSCFSRYLTTSYTKVGHILKINLLGPTTNHGVLPICWIVSLLCIRSPSPARGYEAYVAMDIPHYIYVCITLTRQLRRTRVDRAVQKTRTFNETDDQLGSMLAVLPVGIARTGCGFTITANPECLARTIRFPPLQKCSQVIIPALVLFVRGVGWKSLPNLNDVAPAEKVDCCNNINVSVRF